MAQTRMLLPPIAEAVEPLDVNNQDLYGSIVVSETGQLLKKYLTYEGFSHFLTVAFDNWITNILPKQIRDYEIDMPELNGKIFFDMRTLDQIRQGVEPSSELYILPPYEPSTHLNL